MLLSEDLGAVEKFKELIVLPIFRMLGLKEFEILSKNAEDGALEALFNDTCELWHLELLLDSPEHFLHLVDGVRSS